MKYNISFKNICRLGLLLAYGLVFAANSLFAQEGEPPKKIRARLSLEFTDRGDQGKELKATVKAKIEDTYEKIPGLPIQFYQGEIAEDHLLGTQITNSKGEAVLQLSGEFLKMTDSLNSFYFLAEFEENDQFRGADQELEVWKSLSELVLEEEDSLRFMQFSIMAPDSSGGFQPVSDVNARFFVRRMFGLLPISEDFETTDEDGILRLEFPSDIPGDANGKLSVVAKVVEDEKLGNILLEKEVSWGIPTAAKNASDRTLWGARANAPLPLIFFVNAVILGIWGFITYIFAGLFRIRRLGHFAKN